jgi:dolichyl-phosphate-mannose--protein O-mannosyl transferase
LDNALTVQTRIIALDGLLLVSEFGALAAFLAAGGAQGGKRTFWYVLTGVLGGLAVGTKFTGLAIVILLGIMIAWKIFTERQVRQWVLPVIVMALSAFLVYGIGWIAHYQLLPNPGPGDDWQIPTGNIWADTIDMHQKMLSANYNLTATHPDASPWWTWPMMRTPVYYWQGVNAAMYFLGNPVVWWGGALLFIVVILDLLLGKQRQRIPFLWVAIVGYLVSLAPLMRIPRALFLYHYLTPLLFSLLAGVLWLDKQKSFYIKRNFYFLLALVAIGFLLISPLTYGFATPPFYQNIIFGLFPFWR